MESPSTVDGTLDHAMNLAVILQAICDGTLDLTACHLP